MKPIFIAEIKTKSMFGFESKYPRGTLIDKALEHGDWISVHTDPRFGGSFDDIYAIRRETDKPILAKGFHSHNDDVKKAIDLGATYVLTVDRYTYVQGMADGGVICEISNLNDNRINWRNGSSYLKVIFNGRDLRTGLGRMSLHQWHEYRKTFSWLCGASLIKHPMDIQIFYPGCDAFIVGENLVEFCKTL